MHKRLTLQYNLKGVAKWLVKRLELTTLQQAIPLLL
jgi:hypothetical protein